MNLALPDQNLQEPGLGGYLLQKPSAFTLKPLLNRCSLFEKGFVLAIRLSQLQIQCGGLAQARNVRAELDKRRTLADHLSLGYQNSGYTSALHRPHLNYTGLRREEARHCFFAGEAAEDKSGEDCDANEGQDDGPNRERRRLSKTNLSP